MKKEVFLIILVIVAAFLLLSFSKMSGNGSEEDARKFFEEDLKENYPDADLREINNVTKIGEGPDAYYSLKASVSSNLSTPCPERIEVEYYYPERNFVKRTQKIVYGCKICMNNAGCVITYPEEAIIASHTYEGSESVRVYLAQYPQAKPKVELMPAYADIGYVWKIDWNGENTVRGLRVYISQAENRIIEVQAVQNQE